MEHLDQAGGGDPSRSFPRDLDSEDQDAAMDRDEAVRLHSFSHLHRDCLLRTDPECWLPYGAACTAAEDPMRCACRPFHAVPKRCEQCDALLKGLELRVCRQCIATAEGR